MGPQDYIYASDTVNMQAGGKSFFDSVGESLGNAPALVGGAVISGMSSIYNTGVDAANFFGADAERIDTQRAITDFDQNWGDYYKQNKSVVDTVGFIGTSFIPGGLAVKGLNALRRGEAAGAFGRALNFTATRQAGALDSALQTLASTEGSVFTRMNKDFLGALSWGVADNILQTAVFETAVAATMKASPLLEGQDWKDITYDIVKTSLVGGLIGGGVEGLFMNRTVKDATKLIDRNSAKYSKMLDAFGDRVALAESDKAYSYMDAVLKLPDEVFADERVLDFVYKLGGKDHQVPLNVGALNDATLAKTIKNGYQEFERKINTGLTDDPSVGKGFANSLLKLVQDGKKLGKSEDDIRQRLGDYLFGLNSIEAATVGSVAPEELFRFNRFGSFDKGGPFTPLTKTDTDLNGYRILGDPGQLKTATVGLDKDVLLVKDAWEEGYDIAFKPQTGEWTVNPNSQKVRRASVPSTYQSILRLDSGVTSDTAVLSAADIATREVPLVVIGDTVKTGDRTFKFSLGKTLAADADTVETSARHLWASKLEKVTGDVSADDFSVLDRMSSAKKIVADDVTVSIPGIEGGANWKDLGNFDEWVFQNKVSSLQNMLTAGEQDVTALAYKLNTTPQWIQDVIASKFDTKINRLATGAPDLTTGWQRDLSSYANRDNIVLNYKREQGLITDDFGNSVPGQVKKPMIDNNGKAFVSEDTSGNSFITGQQAYGYRIKLAKDSLNAAHAAVLGPDAARFINITAEELSGLSDRTGSGATLTGFSNADYGDKLKLFAQDTGKNVHLLSQNYANASLTRIQPMLAQLKNSPNDLAELVGIVTKLRRSPESYTILGPEFGLDGVYMVDKQLVAKGSSAETIAAVRDAAKTGSDGQAAYHINSELAANFLQEHMALNKINVEKRKVLYSAQGITSNIQTDTLYVPPIDTRKVPFFAFVRPVEGKIFGDSNVSMITAKNATELQKLASQIDPQQFDVIYKKDTERFFKAKGDYDYSRGINESSINSALKRDGKLGDFTPSFQAEDILEDFVQYHQRQATQLVRDAVSTKYSQTFTELRRLSEQYTNAATSKAEPIGKLFARTVADPFDDYIKTALDISKRSEFTILHQTNEFIDALGTRAYQAVDGVFRDAAKGKVSWEDANSALTRYGLGAPFSNQRAYEIAQTIPDRNLIKTALQKANLALATVTLRFDAANSLMNIISTPIMLGTELSSIKRSIANDPALAGKLSELTSVMLPDGTGAVPSMSKLVFGAISNFWGPEKKALIARYEKNGDIKGSAALYHEMVDDLSLMPGLVPSKYAEKASKWTEKIAGGFGNNFAETLTRFVSADVMRQITEPLVKAGKMGAAEQNAYISVFVNRVQGNYIASQRPILFQGTLGSALGLFQTYQFNLLQQLFRHIEDRNLKTVAVMGGLQTSLFGLNGLPLFEAINTNIIGNANINAGHRDIYSTVTEAAGKPMGDWLMYGTASAFPLFGQQGPALYTRGDINPRHASIIPISPADVPAVDGTIRFVKNLMNVGQKLAAGGDISSSLMEGLEHNSVSRPLAGIAQALQGYSTTSKGSLISGQIDLLSVAGASRVLGAKPLDEAVALNTKFRQESYKAADRESIATLGEAVKTKLRGGKAPTDEEFQQFMGRYAAAGGRAEQFSAAVQAWSKDANTSVLNKLANQVRSPYGQRFVEVMGGQRAEDMERSPLPED